MGMIINQGYMDEEIIKPMMKQFADLEKSIDKCEKKINLAQISLNYIQKYIDTNKKKK